MDKMTRKLKSNDGATLLLALLFFIICAVVGSIILASATTASGSLAGVKEKDQEMYYITSAANMLRHDVNKSEITIEGTIVTNSYTDSTSLASNITGLFSSNPSTIIVEADSSVVNMKLDLNPTTYELKAEIVSSEYIDQKVLVTFQSKISETSTKKVITWDEGVVKYHE